MFSLLGHLWQAKLETLAEGLRHQKGSTRQARGEVSPDLALGHHCRVEPKALDNRTCSFMTKAPGASSLAGVAQRERIQPECKSQTASCLADLLSCLFSLLLSPAQTWSDTGSLVVCNNLTNIYLAFCT